MSLPVEFIQSAIPTAQFFGKSCTQVIRWSVDSRTLQPEDMYIALAGARVDGHDFVEQACKKGALGAVIERSQLSRLQEVITAYSSTHMFIVVENPYQDICTLAAAWRKQFSYPVVGITGSVGKTTTKEILGTIVRLQGMRVLLAQGTQNTLIGISLNMLQMQADHDVAIFELGISKRGEMAALAQLVMPTIAIITSVGHSHMEGLGSLQDIALEKRDIFKFFSDSAIGIINGDQPLLVDISYSHPVVRFGRKTSNQIQARKVQHQHEAIAFHLKVYDHRAPVLLPIENHARIYNALAAAAAAHALQIPFETIVKGIMEPISVPGRYRKCPIKDSSCVIIDDSYNANPESMKAALESFDRIKNPGKKIAVLGDMLGLGVNSAFWHRQLGRSLRKVPSISEVIFVGEQMKHAHKVAPFHVTVQCTASWEEALALVRQKSQSAAFILVKGSRDVGLRKLVDTLII